MQTRRKSEPSSGKRSHSTIGTAGDENRTPIRSPFLPNKILAMAAEGWLLEKSGYKLMILNFVYIFLPQRSPSFKNLHYSHRVLTVRHFC